MIEQTGVLKPQPRKPMDPTFSDKDRRPADVKRPASKPESKPQKRSKQPQGDRERKREKSTAERASKPEAKKKDRKSTPAPTETEIARPRTVYPSDYKPPKIDKDPVEVTGLLDGGYLMGWERRLPHRDHTGRVWYEQPYAHHRLPYEPARFSPGSYYLDSAPLPELRNELAGSKLMEENQKAKDLEIQRSKREHELKAEYERSIEEMTADYRAKLRDLDVNYSDRKRELDRER